MSKLTALKDKVNPECVKEIIAVADSIVKMEIATEKAYFMAQSLSEDYFTQSTGELDGAFIIHNHPQYAVCTEILLDYIVQMKQLIQDTLEGRDGE